MKIVRTNKAYKLYEDDMETLNRLPNRVYSADFSLDAGFFLQERENFEITEKKVYGVHTAKVKKILNSFQHFNRNLGVLLSGDKGIGKSLFVKMLAWKAMEQGLPVIIVDKGFEGLTTFINSIQQEVLVIFDEFDKNFARKEYQNTLLSLFDGMSTGKKLFAITCNKTENLSEFLIGRPGRFHYHIRFQYPHPEEVREYLEDNVKEEFHKEIPMVLCYSLTSLLSFDALRAIAFELNLGRTFVEAMKDLNVGGSSKEHFHVLVYQGAQPLYGAKDLYIPFQEGRFQGLLYPVASFDGKKVSFGTQSTCAIFADLKRMQIDYETGVITLPIEDVTLESIVDTEEIPSFTRVALKSSNFGENTMTMSYSRESKESKEEEVLGEIDTIDDAN